MMNTGNETILFLDVEGHEIVITAADIVDVTAAKSDMLLTHRRYEDVPREYKNNPERLWIYEVVYHTSDGHGVPTRATIGRLYYDHLKSIKSAYDAAHKTQHVAAR
jgi:hypothetical protein